MVKLNKSIELYISKQKALGARQEACLELAIAFFSGKNVSEFEFIAKFKFFMKNGYFTEESCKNVEKNKKFKLILLAKN